MESPAPLDGISITLSTSKGRPLHVYKCIECSYITAKRNHARMHVERIHTNNGKPMPRKRKYELQDGQYQISDVFMARKRRSPWPSSTGPWVQPSGKSAVSEHRPGQPPAGSAVADPRPKQADLPGFLTYTSHIQPVKQKPPSHGPDIQAPASGWMDLGCLPDGAKIALGSKGWVRVSRMQSSPPEQCAGHSTCKRPDAPSTPQSAVGPRSTTGGSHSPLLDDDLWDGLAFPLSWDEAWDGAF